MTRPICIYHANCVDGFTAAWAVWKRFGDKFEYYPGVHGNEPPNVLGRDVLMVDFTYKREVVKRMRSVARSILVLDHHKTAMEDLKWTDQWTAPLNWERHMRNAMLDEIQNVSDSVYCFFDMERSGAGITWDFFHGGKRPLLVDYVEDHDLWRFKMAHTREYQAAVFSYEYSFENWDYLSHADPMDLIREGTAIERKHHKDVAELTKVVTRMFKLRAPWLDGESPAFVEVPLANLPYTLTSDAGHLLCGDEYPFAGCYWDTPDGRVFSLRSREGGADVGAVAKEYGGGGHEHASGFRVPFDKLGGLGYDC